MRIIIDVDWHIFEKTYWVTTSLKEGPDMRRVAIKTHSIENAPVDLDFLKESIIDACTDNLRGILSRPASPVFTPNGVAKPEVPCDSII
jgi:hypothetical protein